MGQSAVQGSVSLVSVSITKNKSSLTSRKDLLLFNELKMNPALLDYLNTFASLSKIEISYFQKAVGSYCASAIKQCTN